MLSQIFKNVYTCYMRLDEKAVTMAQPQKMWSGIHAWSSADAMSACSILFPVEK